MSTPEAQVRPSSPTLDFLGTEPVEWPANVKSYLEDFIITILPTTKAFEATVAKIAWPVGAYRIIPDDLTAQTGVYEWTDTITGLKYLYCNGVATAPQATYADLYALWGPNKWAADSGGNFSLPDTRGRSLLLAGTHADVDVGDVFGPATESSRRGNTHGHARTSLTVTNANESAHTHGAGSYLENGYPSGHFVFAAGANFGVDAAVTNPVTGTSGAGSAHTHTATVGGTIGTDTNEGGSGIVIGSLVVRF